MMEKIFKNKKAMTLPIIAILIIGLVVLVILILILVPGLKEGVEDLMKILGLNDKDTYIRSFEVEQGLEGAIVFKYRFINDDNIWGYELNATYSTGETKFGIIDETKTETIYPAEEFSDEEKKEYLLNGKQIVKTLPSPSGLDAKDYILYAIDNNHRVLEEKKVEWPGMFEEQEKYLEEIMGFIAFAEGLKGLEEDKITTLNYQEDLVMIGFSKDFNEGYGRYLNNKGLGCKTEDILMPEECKDINSCLCLCIKVKDNQKFCHEKGRICYGYEEYDLIGGGRRTCGLEGGFFQGKKQGEEGENNRLINIWQGKEFEDDEEEFNSLAISIDDNKKDNKKNTLLNLKIMPKEMSLVSGGKTIAVKSLIISKSGGGEVVPPGGDEEYFDRCEAGPKDVNTGHIEANRFDYYWNEDSGSCFWCSGMGAKYDPPGDEWGWKEEQGLTEEECLSSMKGELQDRGEDEEQAPLEWGEIIYPVCIRGPDYAYSGLKDGIKDELYWNDYTESCYRCVGKEDPDADQWGWKEEPEMSIYTCITGGD